MEDCVFYISENAEQTCHAGSKARMDVDVIAAKYFKKVATVIPPANFSSRFARAKYILGNRERDILKLYSLNNKKVFMQYPYYYGRVYNRLLYRMADNNKIILFVHDLLSMRNGLMNSKKEVDYFNKCYALIVHNDKMKEYLLSHGVKTKMLVLEMFDYLLDNIPNNDVAYNKPIVFAGNLNKSEFIRSDKFAHVNLNFNLYGPCENHEKFNENICYKGCYHPNEVPYKLEGSFGLIWDGDSISECSGEFGEYLRYNNPHKLSLYIASGLPVIVWDKSATADFVKNNGVGICVSSINDLKNVKIDLDQYENYKKNAIKIQHRLMEGTFTNNVFKIVMNL